MNSDAVHTGDTLNIDRITKQKLLWGCFIALVASPFGFVFRAFIMADWGIIRLFCMNRKLIYHLKKSWLYDFL